MRLTVYSREYCSLCHDMVAALQALQPQHGFALEIVDVDEDEALEARYGDSVPVLEDSRGTWICRYHLDISALHAYLTQHTSQSGGMR